MPADDIDWDDLRYFIRAAKAGTLAGAARASGVEHSTIGRRLSALERRLGAPLFVRGPEGLSLTPLGMEVAPLAEQVERGIVAIQELVKTRQERVRLAIPGGFSGFFADAIARLRATDPWLTVEILSGARTVDLKHGEADLALRIGPVTDQDLVMRKLGNVGWSLYASPGYLAHQALHADPSDLSGHQVIAYEGPLAALPAARWLEDRVKSATVAVRMRETTEMLTAAAAGVGVAVLPCYLADLDPGLKRLTPSVVGTRSISLVYRREARSSESVRLVGRLVTDVVHRQSDRLAGTRVEA